MNVNVSNVLHMFRVSEFSASFSSTLKFVMSPYYLPLVLSLPLRELTQTHPILLILLTFLSPSFDIFLRVFQELILVMYILVMFFPCAGCVSVCVN